MVNGNSNADSATGVKAVSTSFAIIDALKNMNGGRVTDIVDYTEFSKGAVYKHLNTLMEYDLVIKEGTEYRLGFRFLDYGGWLRAQYMGSEMIKPRICELAEETNEVAMFAVREKGRIITLFRENGNRGVSTRTRLGRRLYPNQTAGGKAILSQLPESEIQSVIDAVGLPRATENTITDKAELLDELEITRERGYAINNEESTEGVVAIAVPLVPDDTVIGACSITGPRHRMSDDRLQEDISQLVLSVVNELELNIAHSNVAVGKFHSG